VRSPEPGIDIAGQLPPELQKITVFSAGIATLSREPDAGRALDQISRLAGSAQCADQERPAADPGGRDELDFRD
jgi:molybdate transport system substrate-binding protein